MAIAVECRRCEKKFRAKEEYAGRKTRCPVCHEVLLIGHPTGRQPADAMKAGSNGHKVRADREAPLHVGLPSRQIQAKEDSPLDNRQLEVLKETENYRRPIRHAAIWFRIQFLTSLIAMIILVPVLVMAAATEGAPGAGLLMVLIFGSLQLAWVVLVYKAYKATWDCRRWAPMTMFVLNMLGVVGCLLNGLFATSINPKAVGAMMFAAVFMAVVPAIIAAVCYRAWAAIPRFLDQPAWSQRALTYCGL